MTLEELKKEAGTNGSGTEMNSTQSATSRLARLTRSGANNNSYSGRTNLSMLIEEHLTEQRRKEKQQ